jgi:hypothetical protein
MKTSYLFAVTLAAALWPAGAATAGATAAYTAICSIDGDAITCEFAPARPECLSSDWTAVAQLSDSSLTNCHIQVGRGPAPIYSFPPLHVVTAGIHSNCEPGITTTTSAAGATTFKSLLALYATPTAEQYLVCSGKAAPTSYRITYRAKDSDCHG